ncbi:MAG: 50S ribosomal protein L25/general stress protein Ctc [Syntrophales bacterium LBB04]|nr:50S ribosomal protein L25/general stress protein Ctc [Syntrophales bacterium LBB04]
METSELKASLRNSSGKGVSRRLRKDGLTPGVFYGPKTEPVLLAVNSSDLMKILKGKEENIFINLLIGNGGQMEKFTLIKELQIDPVSRKFLHVDFCEIDMEHPITLDVPIHFKGEAIGIDNGGDLHHIRREIKVSCLFTVLPEFVEVDVSGLEIGDSIKVQDIKLPDGVNVLDHHDTIIASVTAPKAVVKAEPVEEQEAVETPEEGS